MVLTQKETMFLNDLKSQEQLCIDKYAKYEQQASQSKLKSLFKELGDKEKQHLQTLTQMLSGETPMMAQSQTQQPAQDYTAAYNEQDAFLCQDALAMEKHVSSTYNTGIFEFRNTGMRNALNHIQKEEQEHGKQIYDYMSANGMYS